MRRWTHVKDRDREKWSHFKSQFQQLLDAAIATDKSDKGNVQFLNPTTNALEIIAQRGFDRPFLSQFEVVRLDEPSACARAFRLGRRVMIQDITLDRFYEPYLSLAQASGYRAVQSTPIFGSTGTVIGVLSTHFADNYEWEEAAQYALDQYASQIAAVVTELIGSAGS